MKKTTTSELALTRQNDLRGGVAGTWEAVGQSFDQFCLLAGVSALNEWMEADVSELAGDGHARNTDKPGDRWGTTRGRPGFQGGKVELERPACARRPPGRRCRFPVGKRPPGPTGWKNGRRA